MALCEIEGRLTLAKGGRDLQWRLFYQEDVIALRTLLQQTEKDCICAAIPLERRQQIRRGGRPEGLEETAYVYHARRERDRRIPLEEYYRDGDRLRSERDAAIKRAKAAEATLRTIRSSVKETPSNYEEAMKLVWRLQNTALAALGKALEVK